MIPMKLPANEILLRRYLLGLSSIDEQSTVEDRLLTDQACLPQLLRAEEDLTDEYVRGQLEEPEREGFEAHFLSNPERRENVEFAQALNRYLLTRAQAALPYSVAVPRWRVAMEVVLLGAVLALMATLGAMFRTTGQLREQAGQYRAQASQAEQQTRALGRQLDQEREQLAKLREDLAGPGPSTHPGDADLMAMVLIPGMSRAADHVATAKLHSGVRRLRLSLKLEDGTPYQSYRAELQTVEGAIVRSQDGLKAHRTSHNKVVKIELPALRLTDHDYLVILSGRNAAGVSDTISTYYFHVERE